MDRGEFRLLDEFQRDMALVTRPFAVMAERLDCSEDDVIGRLRRHRDSGRIARVGATVRPNTIGASTLAALAVPAARVESVAETVSAEPGVNHCYLREDDWNLWFVVTAPDAASLSLVLQRLRDRTGLPVLDLPMIRAFTLDLGFRLSGPRVPIGFDAPPAPVEFLPDDRPLLQALLDGLAIVPEPFSELAMRLGRPEDMILTRISELIGARIITRLGVILHHRRLGFEANAMAVWNVSAESIVAAGHDLARHPGVTLCYQRRTWPGVWPYGLFSMIHARSRTEAEGIVQTASELPALRGVARKSLFSTRCFQQRGALVGRAA
jgi:DNA-binding Lrp family transcriptional regulator